jgi:hypothetical protein
MPLLRRDAPVSFTDAPAATATGFGAMRTPISYGHTFGS